MIPQIPKEPFRFGIYVAKPHKKWVIGAIIFVFLATGLSRSMILALRNLTNALSTQPLDLDTVWLWGLIWVGMFLGGSFLWRGSGFTGMRWFMNARATSYQTLFEHLSLHSRDYFNSRFAGSLASKIANAVDGTEFLFEHLLWRFIPLTVSFLSYLLIAITTDIQLGGILAFWTIFLIFINIFFALKIQPYSVKAVETQSILKGRIVDSLSNISLVHEYAYVSGENSYINKFINKEFRAGLKRWMVSEWMLVLNGIFISMFIFFMIVTSINLFKSNVVSLGVVVMIIAMLADLSDRLFGFGQDLRDTMRNYGQAQEGLAEILQSHLIVDAVTAVPLAIDQGDIHFNHVHFNYENTRVFKDFSLHIPAGQKVGLIGKSGAGKTTFVSLLLRHFEVNEGEILLDGQNIQTGTLESLRRAIAFVPQDTSLFHRTILENIRYSNPSASIEDIKRASRQAQAHDFIMKLPKDYDTLVGERGVKLSGGQRQRIAIARAFLKNSPILVLDEATSSLDSESEQAVQVALDTLIKGRTVIAIAHRLSTLKKMDRLIIIDQGKIKEDGSPEELLSKEEGVFKKMWESQVEGFIIED